MSDKLISAIDVLISKVCAACNEEFSEAPCEPNDCRIIDAIKKAPTIEAEPVRHARYIPDMNYRTLGNCGLCGGDVTCIQNYCPNCGAKMDGDPK